MTVPRPEKYPTHHKSDWIPGNITPVRAGYYEVGYGPLPALHPRSKGHLTGRPVRYWDGSHWLCGGPGEPWNRDKSIFGTVPQHFWRGLKEQYAYEHH